jgi:hypothetical protein
MSSATIIPFPVRQQRGEFDTCRSSVESQSSQTCGIPPARCGRFRGQGRRTVESGDWPHDRPLLPVVRRWPPCCSRRIRIGGVTVSLTANANAAERTGTLTVASQAVTVRQDGAARARLICQQPVPRSTRTARPEPSASGPRSIANRSSSFDCCFRRVGHRRRFRGGDRVLSCAGGSHGIGTSRSNISQSGSRFVRSPAVHGTRAGSTRATRADRRVHCGVDGLRRRRHRQ